MDTGWHLDPRHSGLNNNFGQQKAGDQKKNYRDIALSVNNIDCLTCPVNNLY